MANEHPGLHVGGVAIWPGWLSVAAQEALVADLRSVVAKAPFFTPVTPRGQDMSVRMTAAGRFGWISDRRGYRYSETHPDGQAWPAIPPRVLEIWSALSGVDAAPECCLINYYSAGARMGLHQDRDEANFDMPVLSISLGDSALFRVGGLARRGKTQSVWLHSGDVARLAGEARLAYHGIDRIRTGSSSLLTKGGRINVTLRVVS